MKAFQLKISGKWAHFKKPETNNNPLSHDLITKTALIGMIGAVLGIERAEMKTIFPILSEGLLYSVCLESTVKKISHGFTSRKAINPTHKGTPKHFEFLKNPSYLITIALQDEESSVCYGNFMKFLKAVQNEESIYTPCLGWHNCPADLSFVSEGTILEKKGTFMTRSFLSTDHIPEFSQNFRIGFDKLPSHQNDDFWNLPDRYIRVIYPDFSMDADKPNELTTEGDYYQYTFDNEVFNIWMF